MEKVVSFSSKTLVPVSVIAFVTVAVMYVATLAQQVKALEQRDSPSREEYRSLTDDVKYIRNNMVIKTDLNVNVQSH